MIIQQIGSTPLATNPMKYAWFYSFFPQWIDAKGRQQQIPILVLPNGDVVFPKKK
jgi:threonine/homoserine/homoserine lactone efflux protein